MAKGSVSTFDDGAVLGREVTDAVMFVAELGVAGMARRANYVRPFAWGFGAGGRRGGFGRARRFSRRRSRRFRNRVARRRVGRASSECRDNESDEPQRDDSTEAAAASGAALAFRLAGHELHPARARAMRSGSESRNTVRL